MPYVGAIHIHSDYSHDSADPLELVRDRALERGLQFLGMTEHAEDLIPEVWREYQAHCTAVSSPDITVIPGLEFRFPQHPGLHLFALGVRDWIAPNTIEDFFTMTRENAAMTVLAHPVLAKYRIPPLVLEKIDGIEIWNGHYNTPYLPDPRVMRLVQTVRTSRRQVVGTVGLDQHDSSIDRRLRVVLPARVPDPLAELKRGRFFNLGTGMQIDAQVTTPSHTLRALTVRRKILDFRGHVYKRFMRGLHHIGVDR
jgi:hypothetical protein